MDFFCELGFRGPRKPGMLGTSRKNLFFDLFQPKEKYKIRIYLLRCLNLGSQTNARDMVAAMAGLDAISSANPYPELIVGDGVSYTKEEFKTACD